jgi:hypothetical protein
VARLADEARSLARALAWHDIRLNYEAIADSYEQLAQSAGELARLRLDYGGTAGVATTIAVSFAPASSQIVVPIRLVRSALPARPLPASIIRGLRAATEESKSHGEILKQPTYIDAAQPPRPVAAGVARSGERSRRAVRPTYESGRGDDYLIRGG